jgi:hypothetical protein
MNSSQVRRSALELILAVLAVLFVISLALTPVALTAASFVKLLLLVAVVLFSFSLLNELFRHT